MLPSSVEAASFPTVRGALMPDHGNSEPVALDFDALRQENAALREALRARDDFLALAAAELRNPMTPIIMAVQALNGMVDYSPGVPERAADVLNHLDRAVTRYRRRSAALLDIAQLAAGTFEVHREPLDLAALVRDVVNGFRPEAADAGVALTLSAPQPLPALWERTAMTHITEALVGNALRHGASPVRVEVQAAGDAVLLTVSDAGPGLSHADQARMDATFEQAVSRRPQPGFGLGLWAVGHLARAVGGSVGVSSTPGLGTAITVTLLKHDKA